MNVILFILNLMQSSHAELQYFDDKRLLQPSFANQELQYPTGLAEPEYNGAIDYRLPIHSDKFRYVGRLTFISHPFKNCSAVLIHPRFVLTNRHCTWGDKVISFIVDSRTDQSNDQLEFETIRVFQVPGYDKTLNLKHEEWSSSYTGFDLSIVELKNPVESIIPVKIESENHHEHLSNGNFTTVGFPGMHLDLEKPRRYGSLLTCQFIKMNGSHLIDTACEATPGQSGGALLFKSSDDDEWSLIGLTTMMSPIPMTVPWVRSVYLASRTEWIESVIGDKLLRKRQ